MVAVDEQSCLKSIYACFEGMRRRKEGSSDLQQNHEF